MNRLKFSFVIVAITALTFALLHAGGNSEAAEPVIQETSSEIDVTKISQAFGHLIGKNLDAPGFSFDLEGIITGMRAAASGEESPMSEEEYSRAIAQIQEKAFAEVADKNLDDAEAFLEENAHHKGIVQLDPGKLQYRIDQEGAGDAVVANATPVIHYTGKYMDGTVFGTSADGEPIPLPLDQTIPGFSRGIVGMKEGEKRTLFIHPELGYGTSGHLAPNSLLVFEVEIIEAQQEVTYSE
jgi:peptidylprolyl isomerase